MTLYSHHPPLPVLVHHLHLYCVTLAPEGVGCVACALLLSCAWACWSSGSPLQLFIPPGQSLLVPLFLQGILLRAHTVWPDAAPPFFLLHSLGSLFFTLFGFFSFESGRCVFYLPPFFFVEEDTKENSVASRSRIFFWRTGERTRLFEHGMCVSSFNDVLTILA